MLYISKLFLCFIIFSFLGWCLEVIYGCITLKRFVNRGFLIGPLCPLYGVGCVLLYTLLQSYEKDPIMLMLASMALCSILEYFASYVMEKIFKTRWWDYSSKKYNINGRICLEMAFPFGLLGLCVVYIVFPSALAVLSILPNTIIYIMTFIFLFAFLVDLIVSFNVIMKFTNAIELSPKDMTEEITRFVRETVSKDGKRFKRLVDSFPNFKIEKVFKKGNKEEDDQR